METRRIPLRFLPGARLAVLREPSGEDELAVEGTDTASAVALLDRLLLPAGPAALAPGRAAELAASDRDQLLAGAHGLCFGDRIASTLACTGCGAAFDFHFDLTALAAHVAAGAAPDQALRLPTGAEEIAVAALPPEEAAAALAAPALGPDATAEAVAAYAARLARTAPVISLDLHAACPECGAANAAAFDVQGYVLGRLLGARAALVRDVHRLASAYGWSAGEILGLRRSLRRAFVAQVEAERAPRRTAMRLGA